MMLLRSGAFVASLVILNALLVSVVAYEFAGLNYPNGEEAALLKAPQPELPARQTEPVNKRPIDAYSEMTRRPLFNQDRLPHVKDDSATSEEDALAFTLVGVVLTPEQQVAIIYSKSQSQPVKVPLWEWIEGWRLIVIEAQGVVLRKGNRSLALALQRTSKAEAE